MRITERTSLRILLGACTLLLLVVLSCRVAPASRSASTDQAAVVISPASAPERVAQAEVPQKALDPLWEIWRILKEEYVYKDKLVPEKLSQAAVVALRGATKDEAIKNASLVGATTPAPGQVPREMRSIWEAWASLYETYGASKNLDTDKLKVAVIDGFIKALDDEHTTYIEPSRYAIDAQDFRGDYQGIGAEIHQRGGRFILNPMPLSPAEAAGLKPGDSLLAVDGESVEDWDVIQVVSKIRGRQGTKVALTIQRLGEDNSKVVSVVRDVIRTESVFWSMTDEKFAYIRVSFFYANTDESFERRLREALAQGARGIVLDLRNNPGGYLNTTVNVAGQLLDAGLVTLEIDGSGKRTEWKARAGGLATKIPLVVLVNQFTASGSEVLAGALQDYNRAKLVGVTTFGKGSVNIFRELSDGGGLYLTSALWYTPKNRLIAEKGLQPDVTVVAAQSARGDPQLDKALELLRQQFIQTSS